MEQMRNGKHFNPWLFFLTIYFIFFYVFIWLKHGPLYKPHFYTYSFILCWYGFETTKHKTLYEENVFFWI